MTNKISSLYTKVLDLVLSVLTKVEKRFGVSLRTRTICSNDVVICVCSVDMCSE